MHDVCQAVYNVGAMVLTAVGKVGLEKDSNILRNGPNEIIQKVCLTF